MKKVSVYRYCLITSLLSAVICGNVYALQGSTAGNGSNARAVHQLGYTGEGIKIGLITVGNVQADHLAFLDANGQTGAFNHNYTGDGNGFIYNFHDTPFAGIIKSRGTYDHPNDIGVAPDAEIHCGRVVNNSGGIQPSYVQNALTGLIDGNDCKVIVTGIAFGPDDANANGQSQWTLMYDYFAEQYDVVFANAAGNYIYDPCTGITTRNITVFGDCYNGITTGGLEEPNVDNYCRAGDVTNYGPTTDGRRKPEVMAPSTYQVAPGYSGSSNNYWNPGYGDGATSWAVPHTAGVAALLLEYANQTADANGSHSEVIKAVIVNSTFPNIDDKNGNPTNPTVWHSQRGYGRIDALRAYQTLSAGRIIRNTTVTVPAGWAYDTMNNGATHTYFVMGKKNERLILTVTWNWQVTRHGSDYSGETSPKFNIDVNVTNSASQVLFSEANSLNNLEKVDILLPADDVYQISLTNTSSTKSRDYALAFELLSPLTGDFDIDYIVDELDLRRMAFDWLTTEPDTDIIADGMVNWLDFAEFADNWLKIEPKYYNP